MASAFGLLGFWASGGRTSEWSPSCLLMCRREAQGLGRLLPSALILSRMCGVAPVGFWG